MRILTNEVNGSKLRLPSFPRDTRSRARISRPDQKAVLVDVDDVAIAVWVRRRLDPLPLVLRFAFKFGTHGARHLGRVRVTWRTVFTVSPVASDLDSQVFDAPLSPRPPPLCASVRAQTPLPVGFRDRPLPANDLGRRCDSPTRRRHA